MNSSEPDFNGEPDPRLQDRLRALPLPETPSGLESRVRGRIRRRRIQRGVLAGVAVIAPLVALFVWQPWAVAPVPIVQQPQPQPAPVAQVAAAAPREIPTDDLAILFAPPPVDSLTIVDRRNAGTVAALNRLEEPK